MMVLSILKINDDMVGTPKTYADVLKTLAGFRTSELNKIRQEFFRLNGSEEDFTEGQAS
jgi:hypothetical protein